MRTIMIGRCCLFLLCLGLANLNPLFVVYAEEPDMDKVLPVASDINEGVDVVVTSDEVGTVEPTPLLCESFHYDCYNCISKGCYWCTYDSLCFSTPEFISEKSAKYDALYPNKEYSCKTEEEFTQETCTAPDNFFSDPMYGGQNWIFEMIKVKPVWQRGYFGNGVRVRVNDEGIESSHPEFAGRIDVSASCDEDVGGVDPIQPGAKHGTVVASLVGATGNNDVCGVGIAPQVTLSSCHSEGSIMTFPELLTYKLDQMDISQNSWAIEGCGKLSELDPERSLQDSGVQTVVPTLTTECPFVYKPFDGYLLFPCDICTLFQNTVDIDNDIEIGLLGEDCVNSVVKHCDFYYTKEEKTCVEYLDLILEINYPNSGGECKFKNIKEAGREALSRGVTEGRDGKGIIYVFAAGNENSDGDDTNFQSYGASTRFTIPVASVGKSGFVAGSSTPGASVFIAGPGGDPHESHTTVIAAVSGGKCSDAGDGTSYAAPVVSGVVALMLEANPDLGWRDVQDILARSAQLVNDPNDPTFAINSADLSHSNKYGFGIVNADLAVNMSVTHTNLGPERMLLGQGSGDLPIFDHSEGKISVANVTIDSGLPFVTENVVIYLRLNHTSRGHLQIKLKSPGGMVSVLTPGFRPEDQTDEWMKLTTVRHRGENPNGEWSIQIFDTVQGDVNSCSGKSQWQWQLTDDFSNNTVDEVLHCEFNLDFLLRRFCTDGQIDRENGYYGLLCNDGINEACELLDKFETDSYDGLKVTDACCICGGGAPPSSFPDYLFEWKVEVYGSNNFTDFFSVDRDNVEFGRGGLRGRNDELRMQADELESFTDGGPLSEVFDGGPLTEVQLCKSISDTICQLPYMAGLCDAITRTGLNETLSDLAISEWTIFAPTNDAFESDPNVSLREGDDLSDVLLYHFVLGRKLFKTDLYCNATITMSNDDDSVTICEDDAPLYQKGLGNQDDKLPMIIESDIEICNGGIIHLVDNLLMLPPKA